MDYSDFLDFNKIKDNIIFRIINYEKNRSSLEQAPYLRLNDLAVTFRWLAAREETGVSTVLIRNEHMAGWNVPLEILVRHANVNTPLLFPARIIPLKELVSEFLEEQDIQEGLPSAEEPENPMWVLTNSMGIHGAGCICYKGVLDNLASRFHDSFYILPSSVHEVILLPEQAVSDPGALQTMVRETNKEWVAEEEILSDQVYYYHRGRKSLTIA